MDAVCARHRPRSRYLSKTPGDDRAGVRTNEVSRRIDSFRRPRPRRCALRMAPDHSDSQSPKAPQAPNSPRRRLEPQQHPRPSALSTLSNTAPPVGGNSTPIICATTTMRSDTLERTAKRAASPTARSRRLSSTMLIVRMGGDLHREATSFPAAASTGRTPRGTQGRSLARPGSSAETCETVYLGGGFHSESGRRQR